MSKILHESEGVGDILTKFVACQISTFIKKMKLQTKLNKSLAMLTKTKNQASHIWVALGGNP